MGSKKSVKPKSKGKKLECIEHSLNSENVQTHILGQKHTQMAYYHGPIPPPAILGQLEEILPGAADRVFKMAEEEQHTRHLRAFKKDEQLANALSNEHSENVCALWMAFTVCVVFGSLGVYTLMNGHEIIGSLLAGTTITSVVASFLVHRKDKKAAPQPQKLPQKPE